MINSSSPRCPRAPQDGSAGRLRVRRPLLARPRLARPLTGLIAAAALLLAPAFANADSSSTLTVVGTSDVSDSGLIPNLIQPEFHAAYPQYTFKYIGTATGTAITDAESGAVGASALIVHAASLENQFVAGGYSYEPYGRAIWTNDFVLAGPTADPAGVGANAAHNIAQAFADIATAGYNGGSTTPSATFVSRGGTPGTTVQEHKIWALVDSSGLRPSSLLLCAVPSSLGGGETPIAAGVADGDACPGNVLPGSAGGGTLPDWYQTTGLTQGPNVVAANACTFAGAPANTCYVFTDRGTFDYVASGGTPSGGSSEVPNLTILTRDDSASAPGGADELINYFHAYIINPAKSPSPVNLTAAQDFVNFITSPTVQSQLSSYLNDTADPGGPPFVADASPQLTASGIPSAANAGQLVTVTGSVTNLEPDYPALADETVTVDELVAGIPVAVASGVTNSGGAYGITFVPPSSGSYQVATGQIQQIENSSLNPAFGDILSPGASAAVALTLKGSNTLGTVTANTGGVAVTGSVGPAAPDGSATVTVWARKSGSGGGFRQIGQTSLAAKATTYALNATLGAGTWQVQTTYQDGSQFTAATSTPRTATVPQKSVKVGFKRVAIKRTKVTVSGTLGQAPVSSGAKVELFFLRAGSLSFKRAASVSVGTGKSKFTLKARLNAGMYALQLEYLHGGQAPSYSKLKTISVKVGR